MTQNNQTTMHTIKFMLPYEDGVISDNTRPMRTVELTGSDIYIVFEQMMRMLDLHDSEKEGLNFELDGVTHEYNDCVMHWYYHSKIDFERALTEMRDLAAA